MGYALDTEADACVGYFDLARRRRGNFMRHDSMLARERLSHEVVIGHLKEGTDGGWLVALPAGPGAHRRQRRENIGVGPEKETGHGRRPTPTIRLPKASTSSPTLSMLNTTPLALLR
jgi:hypothetical protein